MKAIIMAGGKGVRMRPLTCEIPKPMIPVMNKPLMEHIILHLKKHGILDIGVTLMYLPQKIMSYFGDGSGWGVRLTYFVEDSPLGTAGSLLHAASFLDGAFIVISGDCMTDINLEDVVKFHDEKEAIATMVLAKSANPLNYGIVSINNEHFVTGLIEKPSLNEVFSDTVNTGIYVLEPEILTHIVPNRPFDFSRELFPKLLDQRLPLLGLTSFGYWSDVGSFESYMETHMDIMNQKVKLPAGLQPGRIYIGKSTVIEPTASLREPCVIGSNCYIGHKTVIDSYTVIGDNCIIEDQASVKRSIVLGNSIVGTGSELRGCIVGRSVRLKRYVSCFENVYIGDGTTINERSVIKPNIKIWPGKTIDSHSIIDRDIMQLRIHA